jgi:hypothetical protein
MEAVIDYEYLIGAMGKEVFKNVAVASENSIETFCFLPLYAMDPHPFPTLGLGWNDRIIPYSLLFETLAKATADFAHIYSKGNDKCKNLSAILRRSVQNLDSFGCPERSVFRMTKGCSMPSHKFPDKS